MSKILFAVRRQTGCKIDVHHLHGKRRLFLPLYLAAVEPHLLGFIRTKGKVDGFALITNLAFGILQSQVDGDDVAALTGKAPGRNLLQLYTHYIINRQISNAQRNQKYTFPIKIGIALFIYCFFASLQHGVLLSLTGDAKGQRKTLPQGGRLERFLWRGEAG